MGDKFFRSHLVNSVQLQVKITITDKIIVKFYLSLTWTDNDIINYLAKRCSQLFQTLFLTSFILNIRNNITLENDFMNGVCEWYFE